MFILLSIMKNLILIRHAKSCWNVPQKDIDRPISKRGSKDAHLIASIIHEILPSTYVVWSSVSKRTKETAYIFSGYLQIPFETIHFSKDLYTFDLNELEEVIKKCENSFHNLILFGHNEAITKFVNKFGDRNIDNVPTSGVVAMQFNIKHWKHLSKGKTLTTLFPSQFKNE